MLRLHRIRNLLATPSGLLGLGLAQALGYVAIARASPAFSYGSPHLDRPILPVVAGFIALFLLYLATIAFLRNAPTAHPREEGRRLGVLLVVAVLFRAILFFSEPIQEVDLYRYLWDGRVADSGIHPLAYSPDALRDLIQRDHPPAEVRGLVTYLERSPTTAEIFARIHFRDIPTIYPIASQAVFWLVARLTPKDASISASVRSMKGAMLVFDLVTIAGILALLRQCRRRLTEVIVYAWCPLVLKEIANSAHLDAIAIAAVTWAIVAWMPQRDGQQPIGWLRGILGACCLAFATLAKWYPLILLPLATHWLIHRSGMRSIPFGMTYALIVALGIAASHPPTATDTFLVEPGSSDIVRNTDPEPPTPIVIELADPEPDQSSETSTPWEGLAVFLSQWEMNDLLFAIVVENLNLEPGQFGYPWFRLPHIPGRETLIATVVAHLPEDPERSPNRGAFLVARILMALVLLAVVVWLAAKPFATDPETALIQRLFLTLAWLWFLSPTQNPWYWLWALPFIWAAQWPWLLVSGTAFLYYTRFWFEYHDPTWVLFGRPVTGAGIFDFYIVWIEHGIPLLVLAGVALISRRSEQTV